MMTLNQKVMLLFFLGSERKLDPIRIMKGLFIFTMEAPVAWLSPDARYKFIAYSYGPYSRQVDADLQLLKLRGYLQTTRDPGKSWDYYSLTEAGKSLANDLSGTVDQRALTYLHKIREFVLGLTFRRLLDIVYSKYPEYAVNSVFKSAVA